MRFRKLILAAVAAVPLALAGATLNAVEPAQVIGGQTGLLSGAVEIETVSWRPVLWSFFVRVDTGGDKGQTDEQRDPNKKIEAKPTVPTDVAVWEWVEQQVRIRRGAGDKETLRTRRDAAQAQLEARERERSAEKDPARQQALSAGVDRARKALADLDEEMRTGVGHGYEAGDLIPSGWKRFNDAAAIPDVRTWGEDGKTRVQPISTTQQVSICWEPDVLMTLDEGEKLRLLKKNFRVVKFALTAHKIHEGGGADAQDPARVREAAPEAGDYKVFRKLLAYDLKTADKTTPIPCFEPRPFPILLPKFTNEDRGLWELRVVAEVEGRIDDAEPMETKVVEGAIRFAIVDPSKIDVGILNYDIERGTSSRGGR